ncbi:MAG: hypothetical protein IKM73_08115 [Acidaminococcaceae bacterium]|nr:hypothetical protein [Acidaminococcaceae bacterium]
MKKTAIEKSTVLPNLLIIVPAISLLAISTLTRTVWERATIWTFALSALAVAPLFIPSTNMGKSTLASLPKIIPLAVLTLLLMTAKHNTGLFHGGSAMPLFGISIALLTFAGKGKGIVWLPVVMLFSALFSFLLYQSTRSTFMVFINIISATIVLSAAGAIGWFGHEWKWIYTAVSLSTPLSISLFLSSTPYTEYLADLFVPIHPTIYLDGIYPEYVHDHLSQMSFLGKTYMDSPYSYASSNHSSLESRFLVILGHSIGWFGFVLVALLIIALTIGLVLSFKRRKGLGKLFPFAAMGTVVLPMTMLLFTNLGLFDAHTLSVPLFTSNFVVNLLSITLLRLSLTYRADPACYMEPQKSTDLFDVFDEGESDQGENDTVDGTNELRVISLPADEYVKTIVDAFSGQVGKPFKGDLEGTLKGKALLFSRYTGNLSDLVDIFSQLNLQGAEHFVRVSVSEDSNISRLFFGVERVTRAISNQENVDYCVCIEPDLPVNCFSIQVVSTKEDCGNNATS